ncbi:MAG: hypothetical protein Q7S74_02955 [Nanoarchaeota archaeon]|nr:hypothetical protein [Nanoarchaeota archaeon]
MIDVEESDLYRVLKEGKWMTGIELRMALRKLKGIRPGIHLGNVEVYVTDITLGSLYGCLFDMKNAECINERPKEGERCGRLEYTLTERGIEQRRKSRNIK